MAVVFSGALYSKNSNTIEQKNHKKVLSKIGVDYHDSSGWSTLIEDNQHTLQSNCQCGNVALKYKDIREASTFDFINKMEEFLMDQRVRVEKMESFVHMNCVAIEMEKHFSKLRSDALGGKRTNLTII